MSFVSMCTKFLPLFLLTCAIGLGQSALTTRSVYNAYWSTAEGFQATAELHNNLVSQPVVVTPVFYDASGWAVQLPEVNIPPLGNAKVDINAQLAAKGWIAPRSGTAAFQYKRRSSGALTAEVYMENSAESVSFTIPSAETPMASATQNAVFWLPSARAEVYVALQNTSNTSIKVFPSVTLDGQKLSMPAVDLPPYGSSVVELSADSLGVAGQSWGPDTVGGISLTHDGPPGALNTGGWVEEGTLGYSTTMTFQDPSIGNGKLMSTQILVGDAAQALNLSTPLRVSSQLVVYNVADQPTTFQGELVFAQNGNLYKAPIQTTAVAPGTVTQIDLGRVKSEAGVPVSFSTASIILQYSGKGGALMARVYGASEDRAYGFYWALASGAGQSYAESYWTTEGNWTSIISVANFGPASDDVTVELTSNSGTFMLPSISLQPLESRAINVRDLIESRTTDRNGKSFPAGVNFGGYRIYGASRSSRLVIKEHLIDTVSKLSTPFYGEYVYAVSIFFIPGNGAGGDPYSDAPYTVDLSPNADGLALQIQWSDSSQPGVACPSNWNLYSGAANVNFSRPGVCLGTISGNQVGYATIYADEDDLVSDSAGDIGDVGSSNSAQVTITPSISWNGNFITNTDTNTTPQNVVVGQQIFLNGNPGGGSWSGDPWAGSGAAVAGFDSGNTGGPETLIDGSGQNVLFYWVPGGNYSVTYTVSAITGTASFNVQAPSVSVTPTNGTDIFLINNGSSVGAGCGSGLDPDVCMKLTATIAPPNGYSGNYKWVQVVNGLAYGYTASDGSQHSCAPTSTLPALDTADPYPNSVNTYFEDSPLLALTNNSLQSVTASDSFTTFLMWQPNLGGSIYVPVSFANWGWGATVILSGGTWGLSSATYPNSQVQNGSNWPNWSSTATSGQVQFTCN